MLSPKEEYQVRIAVLNMGSSILADASIYLLENELKGNKTLFSYPIQVMNHLIYWSLMPTFPH